MHKLQMLKGVLIRLKKIMFDVLVIPLKAHALSKETASGSIQTLKSIIS